MTRSDGSSEASLPQPDSESGNPANGPKNRQSAAQVLSRMLSSAGGRLDQDAVARLLTEMSDDFTERQQVAIDRERLRADRDVKEMELNLQRARHESEEANSRAQHELEKAISELKLKAETRRTSIADAARTVTLLLVIVVLVMTPLVLMLRPVPLDPSIYAQYMAPVTGIAGTVIGYWFGNRSSRDDGKPT